jgi:flagellar basal-body rod protein FlgF
MSTSNIVLLSGQMALAQAMDIVANNIANSNTTGFKREGIAFDTLLSHVGTDSKPTSFVYDRSTYRDAAGGPIVATGNSLDLAIQGQGYFQVQMPNGSTGYTRAGSLQLNTDGQIVTASGLTLLGDGGSVSIPNTASEINISGDGFVTARVDNGAALAQIGKIVVVKFDDEQKMQPAGNGVFVTGQAPQPATDSVIMQGSIEQSNVQPVTEITDMIRIMRSYEQMTNMISNENQRQNDAVTRLTKTA